MKAFFYGCRLREKLLLTGFLLLAAAIWLSSEVRRGTAQWRDWRKTARLLKNQQETINHRAATEAALTQAAAHLDPARTFNSGTLVGELSRITDQLGVRAGTASEIIGTERSGELAVNTINCTVRNISQAALLNLVAELDRRSPYIGIEQFMLSVAPNGALTVSLRISSVEIVR
ncbi:MAG: hypothetical protein A3G75_15820 [Verrucomicrobia bacterium RIFCSPLOWO2_12_FULL_64_8]|nr:MAG: hypothetical protein A3G75_15820 [Verrucomicrobia bacterium RIFCSPLOWO2_12_FULL_64_8]